MIYFLSEEDKLDGFLNRLDKPSFHHPFHKKNSIVYNQDCVLRDFAHLHYLSKNTLKSWKLGFVIEDTHTKL